MDGIFESGDEYNPTEKRKILIAFDYMIVDILSYKKLKSVVTELFIIGRKLFLLFLSQSYFKKCFKKFYTKFYSLLYRENSKQKRALTNGN